MKGILIGAPSSGCGKTTVALGLMRALSRRGLIVQPFKTGPDYIDTQFHRVATGRDSYNLDLFMSSGEHVRSIFSDIGADADISIVEGAMGLFDGYSHRSGSSGDVAETLGLPVILTIDARSAAFSVAAIICGFSSFDPRVNVKGVIFNHVGSVRHAMLLREAAIAAGVECLGMIPRIDNLQTPSRHLGLALTDHDEMAKFINYAADIIDQNIDLERILDFSTIHSDRPGGPVVNDKDRKPLHMAIAYDDAFNFIYPANIRALQRHPRYDIRISYFSPLSDKILPPADLLYLPGGYPELYADKLEDNRSIRNAVSDYVKNGGRTLAECGGMIYLCKDIDGRRMCGVIPSSCTMHKAKLNLGYREVRIGDFSLRGHEFHYSRLTQPDCLTNTAIQKDARGRIVHTPLYRIGNAFAGYTHFYWGETDILRLWGL